MTNATDLGTFESQYTKRLRDINARIAATEAKRTNIITIAVAAPAIAALVFVWTAYVVVPAFERVNDANQEAVR